VIGVAFTVRKLDELLDRTLQAYLQLSSKHTPSSG
jgi:hypothetical protein